MIHNLVNQELLEQLDKIVFGHTEAKKTLINLINRSKKRHFQKWGLMWPEEELLSTHNCLLVGGSGTGKTFLVHSLQKLVGFPLLSLDATMLNPTGASGGIKPENIARLMHKKAVEYANIEGSTYFSVEGVLDQMVVFIDEFDKLSNSYDGSSGNWNEHVQSHFLTMLDSYDEYAGVSFICAGAFSGLSDADEVVTNIGFSKQSSQKPKKVSDDDIVSYGLLPEIVGRMHSICVLDRLGADDYRRILRDSLLPKKMQELESFGVTKYDISDETIEKIIDSTVKSRQGVRFLQRELDRHCVDLEFNYEEITHDKS